MNEKLVYVGLVSAIVVAALAIGVAGQTSMKVTELVDRSNAQSDVIVKLVNSNFNSTWVNKHFISEGEFYAHNIILNNTLTGVTTDLSRLGNATSTLQNKFIIIEHTSIIPTTTPDSLAKCAADFDLKTLKITGEFEDRFQPTQAVFIRGDYKAGVQGDYKITRGSQEFKSNTVSTSSEGSFLGTFNDALDQSTGLYTAEFQLGGLSDCISFYIE